MAKNPLPAILESNKLNDQNYMDWIRNLKIVLNSEKRFYVVTDTPPNTLHANTTPEKIAFYEKWKDDDLHVKYIMLVNMNAELQKQ